MKQSWAFDDHVELYLYEEKDADGLPPDWQSLASPAERERAASMGSPARAHTFLRTRALLRRKLTDILGGAPAALPIAVTPEGKPFLEKASVTFSVSHSHGLILIGISKNAATVGVDLQYLDPTTDIEKVAQRFFDESEREQISAANPDDRRTAGFQIWCMREARYKAGIAGPAAGLESSGLINPDFAYAVCCGPVKS